MSVEVWQDHCRLCGAVNERKLDAETGRYVVLFPANCPTKDECEQRILCCDAGRPRKTT